MTPKRLQLPSSKDLDPQWLSGALEVLARDGLVVLPTETVYGLAARADSEAALASLSRAKGTESNRPWTWHVASASALDEFESPAANIRRLTSRYWPGPLTLVLPGVPAGLELVTREDWTGVRCTAGEFSSALCAAAPFPLVMTSANPQGAQAPVDASDLGALLLGEGDLVLDGGPTALQESSSVLQVGRGKFELLRQGLHDLESLRRTAGRRIAFACTGNTCRSPMAEGLARAALARRLGCLPQELAQQGFEVLSMGIYAGPGSPAAQYAIDTLSPRGIDISGHRSRQATPELVEELDSIFCLTSSHLAALQQMLPPKKRGKLHLLAPDGHNIGDPIGGGPQIYEACAKEIEGCVDLRINDWA
jgi:L-threonylcarbamoyladenylate synthase